MDIKWYGHSCFLFENNYGIRLLTDPFNSDKNGLNSLDTIDIITISHLHFDHNHAPKINGNPIIIKTPGCYSEHNISIKGIPCYHDNDFGFRRGKNIIFLFEMDGIKFCHLGDIGHPLTDKLISDIGKVDILLVPIGGNYTISGKEASHMTQILRPNIVIPMHYRTPFFSCRLEGAEDFITNMKNCTRLSTATLSLKHIPETYNNVLLFNYD